jgi:predicted aspartyl protease
LLIEWGESLEARDYFDLRSSSSDIRSHEAPKARVILAALHQDFNEVDSSSAILDSFLSLEGISDSLRFEARSLRLQNAVRLHRYGVARETAEAMLRNPPAYADSSRLANIRNMERLARVLTGVPPLEAEIRASTIVHGERGLYSVGIDGRQRQLGFDTGANMSVLMRSEAQALGLDLREAGIDVGTATDIRIRADVAVADSVRLGSIVYRHVPFLVMDDELLTFGEFRIPGLLGFPLLRALDEVWFGDDGSLEVPASAPHRIGGNLALDELTLLVSVRIRASTGVCIFDTGADDSDFFVPFLEKQRAWVEQLGVPDTVTLVGVGGPSSLPAFEMPQIDVELAGRTVTLHNRPVLTRPLDAEDPETLDCRLGMDAIGQLGGYAVSFRDMTLLPLRGD